MSTYYYYQSTTVPTWWDNAFDGTSPEPPPGYRSPAAVNDDGTVIIAPIETDPTAADYGVYGPGTPAVIDQTQP